MHVSANTDLVEIREGTMYYQLNEYFSYKGSLSTMRIYLLQVCAVRSEVSKCVKRPIHTSFSTVPKETTQGNTRLGGKRRRFARSL